MSHRPKRVMLIASGGGHWVQLLRLGAAWRHCDCCYVTVQAAYAADVPGQVFHAVTDATRWDRWKLVKMALQVAGILVLRRPEVVITTGAAPGLVALRLGKWMGARTVWIDSMANVEELSLSGRKAGRFVDLWLTQWPHLARPEGPHFLGSVL